MVKNMAIRYALKLALDYLRKLVTLLEETNEQDVANKVDDLRKQIKATVEKRKGA